jgi:hypothetical protein
MERVLPFAQEDLDDQHVMLLDAVTEVYAWFGGRASKEEKLLALHTMQARRAYARRGERGGEGRDIGSSGMGGWASACDAGVYVFVCYGALVARVPGMTDLHTRTLSHSRRVLMAGGWDGICTTARAEAGGQLAAWAPALDGTVGHVSWRGAN